MIILDASLPHGRTESLRTQSGTIQAGPRHDHWTSLDVVRYRGSQYSLVMIALFSDGSSWGVSAIFFSTPPGHPRMISQRQIAFRQEYRSRILGWYDGYFHIAIIYAMGAAAFYIYVRHIHDVTLLEWLTVPLTFLFTNLFEWEVHRFVMHRPVNIKGLRSIYERHTLNHHQFFTDDEMRFRDHKDWRVTVFPPYALVVFILMSLPMAVILGLVFTPNVGWLFMCVTTGMYLIYEFMHFCCHVEENWFVRNCPFVNTLRRHHTAHHNARLMMEVNMNVTFPIADWLFGTSDLDRGFLGHLFNGYDTRFLKKNLRGSPRGPDEAVAMPVGSYY